jgi:sugar phosphate isomerase/epimerase
VISVSTLLPTAKRVAPFADRHKLIVSMHNHARVTDPNECATLESFDEFMKLSTYYRLNLDIGHFTAANYDSIAYIRDHHDLITHLHVKDRKKNQGDNVSWGQGDTPIADVLKLLAARKSPIRAFIEYEYQGTGTPVEEVKKCLDTAKSMLKGGVTHGRRRRSLQAWPRRPGFVGVHRGCGQAPRLRRCGGGGRR